MVDFHKRILFSDEAYFWLSGYVNKQNCRIWSEANPQVYVETPLHPEKLTVWCTLWAGGIIGPYFFKNDEGHNVTVNGGRYRAMITNFFLPELNNHDAQKLWFQQDGATCHTARATIDLLKDTFGDRLISRFGPVNWPPRSCDLTPLDYFLWGYVKSLVYEDKPQTLLTIWKTTFAVLLPIYDHKCWKKSSKIGRPDWTTSEPAVAVLYQKSYLKSVKLDKKGTSSGPVMKSIAALLVLFCFIAAVSCQAGGIQCSPPKCDAPCYLNYKTKPCPSCDCSGNGDMNHNSYSNNNNYGNYGVPPMIQCDPPKCDAPCTLNYNTKPCPSCDCSRNSGRKNNAYSNNNNYGNYGVPPMIQCDPPKCDAPCTLNYNTKPCPSCDCSRKSGRNNNAYSNNNNYGNYGVPPMIQCDPPKCDAPCTLNYNTKPCPSCDCSRKSGRNNNAYSNNNHYGNNYGVPPMIQCDPPKCDAPCSLNYSTKPCPSCDCSRNSGRNNNAYSNNNHYGNNYGVPPMIQCDPPKCDAPCTLNYNTKPCPSCDCSRKSGRNNNAYSNNNHYGNNYGVPPMIQCDPPKCDAPCTLNYNTKPCPSCDCSRNSGRNNNAYYSNNNDYGYNYNIPQVQCSPPKCDAPCTLNYSTKPCPSCDCSAVNYGG
ncbi:DUF4817 domain-containing protein [Trichonephila clavipes]|uniref:DUF4817 domain-containing protein n=1 Tax=Trichonephila clavipes TaxID=2585209 RepID=A0A8X7BK93_TRICX|nr:DUF4817 domain-containing protein [Trichonephila clavipes]